MASFFTCNLLQENGGRLLQENTSRLLLENCIESGSGDPGGLRKINHHRAAAALRRSLAREAALAAQQQSEPAPEPVDFARAAREALVDDLIRPAITPRDIAAEERYEALRAQRIEQIRQQAQEAAAARAKAKLDAQNAAAFMLLMGD